jgi:hypothetical protein
MIHGRLKDGFMCEAGDGLIAGGHEYFEVLVW